MASLVKDHLGRYEILEILGAGGMGEVYRARDTRLDRYVAIKVISLSREASSKGIERFKREARAVARLSHPNILEIFDFGEDDDLNYAVMELLEGADLRARIRRGRIPVHKAIGIAQQTADGLGAAHSAGIIHRDIKPENLFLTQDGRLKILDFGLAHLRQSIDSQFSASKTTESLTGENVIVGTPRYMSPEQIRGQEVDAASDIFSLGCVIYEMISGSHPFLRDTGPDTLSAILSDEPKPLTATVPDLPVAVDELVLRCLEKEASDRLESARDLGFALRAIDEQRVTSGRLPRWKPMWQRRGFRVAIASAFIAILLLLGAQFALRRLVAPPPSTPDELHLGIPRFQVAGDDRELLEIAGGLYLAMFEGLAALERNADGRMWVVPPRTAAKEGAEDCQGFFRLFNASICLLGNLERVGDRLVLSIEARSPVEKKIIASRSITDDWGNLSRFQSAPILEVASLLGIDVDAEFEQLLEQSSTNVTPALAAYLRGSGALFDDVDESAARSAVSLLEEATRLDPLHRPSWEMLAVGYRRLYGLTGDREWLESGFDAVQESLDRGATAQALVVLASLSATADDISGRIDALERAVELDPLNADAFYELGLAYEADNRAGGANHALQRAINLRPGYWPYHNQLAHLYFKNANYDAATNQWRQVTQLAPQNSTGFANLGVAYWYLGNEEAVEREFKRSIELQPADNYWVYSNLGTLFFGQARYADAVAMFKKALDDDDSSYIVWGNLGFAYTQGANPELSVEPLRKAIALAEEELGKAPAGLTVLTNLASYHAMLGEEQPALGYLDQATGMEPTDPEHMVTIGEAYLDIGHRDEAIVWIRGALQAGMPEERLMARPELRELIDEARLELPSPTSTQDG